MTFCVKLIKYLTQITYGVAVLWRLTQRAGLRAGSGDARLRTLRYDRSSARRAEKENGLSINFDVTDYAIVDLLREDGRATNQQIAEALGLTAVTVSTRIRRMEDANQLRVVAVSDFAAHGFDLLSRVKIKVDGRAASAVAQDLAALDDVFAVHMVSGEHDIDMLVALRTVADMEKFLLDKVAGIEGIDSTSSSLIVDIVKYQFDVVPLDPES